MVTRGYNDGFRQSTNQKETVAEVSFMKYFNDAVGNTNNEYEIQK